MKLSPLLLATLLTTAAAQQPRRMRKIYNRHTSQLLEQTRASFAERLLAKGDKVPEPALSMSLSMSVGATATATTVAAVGTTETPVTTTVTSSVWATDMPKPMQPIFDPEEVVDEEPAANDEVVPATNDEFPEETIKDPAATPGAATAVIDDGSSG
jgi:hypothetical protein